MIDMAPSLRAAIVATSAITTNLPAYLSSYPVFTRRPVPDDTPFPCILITEDIAVNDVDMLTQGAPRIVRDIMVYGRNDSTAEFRTVETIAYAIRDLFHRVSRLTLTPTGWNIIDVVASGPRMAPTDDDKMVGRVVSLLIRVTPSA